MNKKYLQKLVMLKKEKSTLYSFDGLFQLILAGVGSLELLGKSETTPRYVLLIVDLYS